VLRAQSAELNVFLFFALRPLPFAIFGYLRDGFLFSDSFDLSLLLAGVLALLLLLLLRFDELEDSALWLFAGFVAALAEPGAEAFLLASVLWVWAGLVAALAEPGAEAFLLASVLWVWAGLVAALSEPEAGALLLTSVLWVWAGLVAALSGILAGVLREALEFWTSVRFEPVLLLVVVAERLESPALVPAPDRSLAASETDLPGTLLTTVLSAVLLVWFGCVLVKSASPSRLCSGWPYVAL
jgi:hypothetical protein